MHDRLKLNLGCGSSTPNGWVNVDYALGARLARIPMFRTVNKRIKLFNLDWNDSIHIHNLTKPLPWKDASIDVVYTSHTLEHFPQRGGLNLLKECHRILRQGGIIRIVVPDLAAIVKRYLDGKIRADEFIENLHVLYSGEDSSLKSKLAPFFRFPHKCMYDTPTLLSILQELKFEARERKPFDSDIEDIRSIEIQSRTADAVIIEGRKT